MKNKQYPVNVIHEKTGKLMGEFDSIIEAEALIATIEKTDPEGVHAGHYGINATEHADSVYQSIKR